MRKRICINVICLMLLSFITLASSGTVPPKATSPKGKKQAPVARRQPAKTPEEQQREEQKKMIENKKASLNNTEWEITVTSFDRQTTIDDLMLFKKGKISVRGLLGEGFSETNYTLSIQDDGRIICETMQTGPEEEIVFIRVEVSSDVKKIQGIITYPHRKINKDYFFTSVNKKLAAPE